MRILRFQRPNFLRRFHLKPDKTDASVASSKSMLREDTTEKTEKIEKWLEIELKYNKKGKFYLYSWYSK